MKKTLLGVCLAVASAFATSAQVPQISPAPVDGTWAADTKWYYILNEQQNSRVSTSNADNSGNLQLNSNFLSLGKTGLWAIVGSDTDGYKFYNYNGGVNKVLGMSAFTGNGNDARAKLYDNETVPENIQTSFDIKQSKEGWFCIVKHGTDYDAFNKRNNNYLAIWQNSAAVNGSTVGSNFRFEALSDKTFSPDFDTDNIDEEAYYIISNSHHTGRNLSAATVNDANKGANNCLAVVNTTDRNLSNLWKIKKSGDKYVIYNEWNNSYIGTIPTANNKYVLMQAEETNAGHYALEKTGIGFVRISDGQTYDGTADRSALHGTDWGAVVRWSKTSDPSEWNFIKADDNTFAELCQPLINQANALGQFGYQASTDAINSALNDIISNRTIANAKKLAQALEENNTEIILPEAGKLYTIRGYHNNYSDKYLAESYTVQNGVTVGNGDDAVTTQYNKVLPSEKASDASGMWLFSPCCDTHSGNYLITAVNSGNAMRYSEYDVPMTVVPANHAHVGHYTILDQTHRAGGVTLRSPNATDNGTASIETNAMDIRSWNGMTDGNNWVIELVNDVTVTTNAEGYAQVSYPFAVTLPEALTAYAVKSEANNVVTLTATGSATVAANAPVIVKGTASTPYTLAVDYTNAGITTTDGPTSALKGTTVPQTVENAYVLSGNKLTAAADGLVPANSIYLVSANDGDKTLAVEDTTGISEIAAGPDAKVFDLQGRRLAAPVKGINIIGGRKVMVK